MLKTATAAAVVGAGVLLAGSASAAMHLSQQGESLNFQQVDCAVGFHIGPLGTCVIGTAAPPSQREVIVNPDGPPVSDPPGAVVSDPAPPAVIERRSADEGCETRSVQRNDGIGNSETRTRTDCD